VGSRASAVGLAFDFEKVWVALIEVRHTPKYVSATLKAPDHSSGMSAIMLARMVYARIVFFALFIRIPWDTREGAKRLLMGALLLAVACTPCVVVFSYERHMVPILVMAGAFFVFLYLTQPRNSGAAVLGNFIPRDSD
jgi:hypothetical protein